MSYYAVAKGKHIGIFLSFNDCNKAIKGFKHPLIKKCNTLQECERFIIENKHSKSILQNEYIPYDVKFTEDCQIKNKVVEKKTVTIEDKSLKSKKEKKTKKQKKIKEKKQKQEQKEQQQKEQQQKEEQQKEEQQKEQQKQQKQQDNSHLEIYTDGSCINNGRANAASGIGIYFGPNDKRNVSKKISGKQTNNTAELTAIIYSFKILEEDINNGRNITIHTDSEYAIKCATTYGEKMEKIDWKKDIPNKELVQIIYSLYNNTPNVNLKHIRAHTGKEDKDSIGNENADRLANEAVVRNNFTQFEKPKNKGKRKIYLNVPYTQKNNAKKLGALWDPNKKKWFVYENNKNKGNLIGRFSM